MTDQESNNRERLTELEWEIEQLQRVREAIGAVVVGNNDVIDQLLISLLGGGHVLIEGAPGLGKTLLVRTMATVCGLDLSRIQFTPDLMPADITGTVILLQDEQGRSHSRSFQQGPIFAQMVLADEINRATPKTQSALLEAMQERTVTVAGSGHALPEPFFVLATQNPVEMEGTYRLPEAQIDRFFFKVVIGYPSTDILDDILAQTTGTEEPETTAILEPGEILRLQELTRGVPLASHVRRAVAEFVQTTQPDNSSAPREVQRFIRFGISPRGAQALILAAKASALMNCRYNVGFSDLEATLHPALRHRFQLNFEGHAEGKDSEALLGRLFRDAVSVHTGSR